MAKLKQMTATQVERLVGRRYAEVCGEQSRSGNKDYLVKRVAWRGGFRAWGANEFGDLPERARRRAMEIASDADLRLRAPAGPAIADPGSPRAGPHPTVGHQPATRSGLAPRS